MAARSEMNSQVSRGASRLAVRLGLIACGVAWLYLLSPLLSTQPLAGWDTPGHRYLVGRAVHYIKSGELSGYNWEWYCGYPEFSLYPIGAYLFLGLLQIAFPGDASLDASFNLMLFASALGLFVGTVWCGRKIAGRLGSLGAGIATVIVFAAGRHLAAHGIGMSSMLLVGLVPQFVALPLCMLGLGAVLPAKGERSGSSKGWLFGGALAGVLCHVHYLTAVFFAFCLVICGSSTFATAFVR